MKIFKYAINSLLGLLMCAPVITIGAALTAMHFVNFKLEENADVNVFKEFFKSFKQNFKQSLAFLIIILLAGGAFTYMWINLITAEGDTNLVFAAILLMATLVFFQFEFMGTYLLAKFENTTKKMLMLTVYTVSKNVDRMVKVSLVEATMIALPILIYAVNPGSVSLAVSIIAFFVLLVVFEIVSSKNAVPIYEALIKEREEHQRKLEEEQEQENVEE